MVRKKPTFKCDCGHLEDEHNWDAYSSFFGCCMFSMMVAYQQWDGSVEPDQWQCPCNRFQIDNLRFLEEMNARRETNIHRRSQIR